jgi:hypothetical protein
MTSPHFGNQQAECRHHPRAWRFFGHFCQTSGGNSQQTMAACSNLDGKSSSLLPLPKWHDDCFAPRYRTPHLKERFHMKKLTLGLWVALATTVTLSGCQLYFGEDKPDSWSYCDSSGYWQCEGNNDCVWVSAECPDPGAGSGGSAGGGFECTSNSDCAAGCYCSSAGVCEEAGFCTTDADCGDGYVCNTDRSSCEPGCTSDAACDAGQVCDAGNCTATCVCSTDVEATMQGFDYCDESRTTCMLGTDPAGTCAGEPTCNLVPPACPAGQVPLLGADGCWTGQCEAAQACSADPPCSRLGESDCLSTRFSDTCKPIVNGINCTKPNPNGGTLPCQPGDSGCTCQNYVFASCTTR